MSIKKKTSRLGKRVQAGGDGIEFKVKKIIFKTSWPSNISTLFILENLNRSLISTNTLSNTEEKAFMRELIDFMRDGKIQPNAEIKNLKAQINGEGKKITFIKEETNYLGYRRGDIQCILDLDEVINLKYSNKISIKKAQLVIKEITQDDRKLEIIIECEIDE